MGAAVEGGLKGLECPGSHLVPIGDIPGGRRPARLLSQVPCRVGVGSEV